MRKPKKTAEDPNLSIDTMADYMDEFQNYMSAKKIAADIDVARLLYCVSPHRYATDSIYGHNDLSKMLHDDVVTTKYWPKPPATNKTLLFSSTNAGAQSVGEFFTNLIDEMEHDYAKELIANNMMRSYEDIVIKSNLIDLSSAYKCSDGSKIDVPDFKLNDKTVKFLRTHDWYSFIPCFDECTVRLNRKRYLNIRLISMNEKDRTMAAVVADYSGDKYDWIMHAKALLVMKFPVDEEGNVGLQFDIPAHNTYEELLMAYVDKMKWDDRHKQFWADLFSLTPTDRYVAVNVKFPMNFREKLHEKGYSVGNYDDDTDFVVVLRNTQHMLFMKDVFGIDSEVVARGEDAVRPIVDDAINLIQVLYINVMALINLRLFSEPRIQQDDQSSDPRDTYKFGDITIKSETLPIIPSNKHVTKTSKIKEVLVKQKP